MLHIRVVSSESVTAPLLARLAVLPECGRTAACKAPNLYLVGIRPVSDLINSPNFFSVVVAILAGLVGLVSRAPDMAQKIMQCRGVL